MRIPAATLLLALLAAGALTAAKPVPPFDRPGDAGDQTRERWRGQGISLCVAELRAVPALGPADLESICGCAVDRLGAVGNAGSAQMRIEGALGAYMVTCTARLRPDRVTDVARWRTTAAQSRAGGPDPVVPPMPPMPEAAAPDGPKPIDDSDAPTEGASGESSGGGLWDWFRNLDWSWLTGASLLWWVAIGIFLFGLLILKIRRRDPRNDLIQPPGHMRRGAPLQPPRRPDLPR